MNLFDFLSESGSVMLVSTDVGEVSLSPYVNQQLPLLYDSRAHEA